MRIGLPRSPRSPARLDDAVQTSVTVAEWTVPLRSRQSGHGKPMKPLHILLIEDDFDSAEALQLLLRGGGFQVECVASARQALSLYERDPHHHADLILLDLMLP